MTSLHPDTFNQKAAKPAQLDAAAYQAILEKLLGQGEGWGKNKQVGAYLLEKLEFETMTTSGKVETRNSVDFEKKMYIVMDTDQYPSEYLRNLVIQDITKKWGGKQTAETALYTIGKDGTPVAKFDVYGMAPEFLEDNYKPVNLSEATHKTMRAFKTPKR